MKKNGHVVKWGIALYDNSVPYNIKIVKSDIFYGSGDHQDPSEFQQDREIPCYYIWYDSPSTPNSVGPFSTGGGGFESLNEAIESIVVSTLGTVKWLSDVDMQDMIRKEHEARWQITHEYFAKAVILLGPDIVENEGNKPGLEIGSLAGYADYLDHNELELALEQLVGIGENNSCSNEYWALLKLAATNMELHNLANSFDTKISSQ